MLMATGNKKLFIGGISRITNENSLREHFLKYGEIQECQVLRNLETGLNRGFAFIVFSDPSSSTKALADEHVVLGKKVEVTVARPKVPMPRDQYNPNWEHKNGETSRNLHGDGWDSLLYDKKKIFVGGLPRTLTEVDFKKYFESFGMVTDAVIIHDKELNRSRGFGFITFDSEEVVDNVLRNCPHKLNDKEVDVKKARLKTAAHIGLGPSGGVSGDNAGQYLSGFQSFGYGIRPDYYHGPGSYYYGAYDRGVEAFDPYCIGYGGMSFPSFGHYYHSHFQIMPYACWSPCTYPTYLRSWPCFGYNGIETDFIAHARDTGFSHFRPIENFNENRSYNNSNNACSSSTREGTIRGNSESTYSSLKIDVCGNGNVISADVIDCDR